MKSIKKLCLLALVGLMVGSCEKSNPAPQKCIEGIVIAQSRVDKDPRNSLISCATVVQITNRTMGKTWFGAPNCVYIPDMPKTMETKGTKIYFTAYTVDTTYKGGPLDCIFPPDFAIVAENLSTKCPSK